MNTQAVSTDHSLLLKIIEMKGSFEAEWDLAIAVTKQENPLNDPELTKHHTSTQAQAQSLSTDQASTHDETRTRYQGSIHDTNPINAQRPALPQTGASTPATN